MGRAYLFYFCSSRQVFDKSSQVTRREYGVLTLVLFDHQVLWKIGGTSERKGKPLGNCINIRGEEIA
jgi:hypothetical protein